MKMKRNNYWELAEKYLKGQFSPEELSALERRLETDIDFATDFQANLHLIQSLEGSGKQKRFKALLTDITIESGKSSKSITKTISLKKHYMQTAAIAAGIAILTTLSTFWMITHHQKKNTSQYSMLRKEVESIKRHQKAIIENISEDKNTPALSASYTGTGTALTNDGFFVTNYHVVEGADSVYIQHANGKYYKSNLIAFDKIADVAILKVNDKSFSFDKHALPYTFAKDKNGIGAQVYTLGYPDDEVIYNEGYISAQNGYNNDSLQYLLELPSKPGHSGAPVMDKNGNVIAIVSAKDNQDPATTYAVSSTVIYSLISDLPIKIKLPRNNSIKNFTREKQVARMSNYTCSVKVYKAE